MSSLFVSYSLVTEYGSTFENLLFEGEKEPKAEEELYDLEARIKEMKCGSVKCNVTILFWKVIE